jgi:hypothetical protein
MYNLTIVASNYTYNNHCKLLQVTSNMDGRAIAPEGAEQAGRATNTIGKPKP